MSTRPFPFSLRTLGPILPLALLLAGCNDSVTCIFTTGCQGGAGALSDNAATLPVDGDWIVDGPPDLVEAFPSGTQNSGTTPIVLVFSESMNPTSLLGAIEVFPLVGGAIGGPAVQGLSQALVSDGRVLVLLPLPQVPLPAGDYLVRLAEDAEVLDLTGQELARAQGSQLGNFGVAVTQPSAPRLVMTYPADGAVDQGETTEIVAVFDRVVEQQSVDGSSFDVTVDGLDPLNDPPATPIVVQVGANTALDTRAFVYRSVGADGRPAPLGTDVEVELRLSPATDPISESDNDVLPPATVSFQTLPFAPPLAASFLSAPPEAIGLANLTPGDPEELTVEVELDGLQPNDSIDLVLFGTQRSTLPDPPLIALQRSVRLAGTAPIQSVIFTRADVAMQFSDAPDDARFNDGPLTFAFRARRGTRVTPLRLLDLDPDPALIQDPLLDTSAPQISALVGSSGTAVFRSDQRGLSLAGQADEELRSIEVSTPLGGNGTLPPVVGSSTSGLFLAAPVPLGVVAGGGTDYTFVARDEALNSTASLAGAFTQLGALGATPWSPGDSLEVEVFDARTLDLLPGARVLVHSDLGNGSYPFFQSGLTLADGRVSLSTGGPPAVAAIVTVVLPGYDLFTLHGVATTRLSVPLRPSNLARARAIGQSLTSNAAAVALLPGLDRRFDDSRRGVELPRGFVGVGCSAAQGLLACAYGPEGIAPGRLGVRSFFAGDFTQVEAGFSAAQLLQAFALTLPFAPVAPNVLQSGDLEVPYLLIDATVPAEEVAQVLPAFTFRVDALSGVDLLDLQDDPTTTGAPFATVETLVPGAPGAIAVAQGLTYDQGGGAWTVRSAQPGAITPAGSLGSEGAVDTDPFVRVEAADQAGNSAGARPRLSQILAAGPAPEFRALSIPTQLTPAAASSTGGQAFLLELRHVIGDERAAGGLYRVELEDDSGRAWILWRFDPAGTADIQVRVVDVGDGGGVGLADGTLVSLVSAYAWAGFSSADFLWSDVERRFELFARAAPISFLKP